VCGHIPHGDCPTPINSGTVRVITADTSYRLSPLPPSRQLQQLRAISIRKGCRRVVSQAARRRFVTGRPGICASSPVCWLGRRQHPFFARREIAPPLQATAASRYARAAAEWSAGRGCVPARPCAGEAPAFLLHATENRTPRPGAPPRDCHQLCGASAPARPRGAAGPQPRGPVIRTRDVPSRGARAGLSSRPRPGLCPAGPPGHIWVL
jgi:hypothetical protein